MARGTRTPADGGATDGTTVVTPTTDPTATVTAGAPADSTTPEAVNTEDVAAGDSDPDGDTAPLHDDAGTPAADEQHAKLDGDHGLGAQADDPTVTNGDAGRTVPAAGAPGVITTAAATVGSTADRTLYGTIDSRGNIKPTGNGGADDVPEGERGVVIVAAGDTITRTIAATLSQES